MVTEGPTKGRTMSPIELFWTAKRRKKDRYDYEVCLEFIHNFSSFEHKNSRSDRDEYIKILINNLIAA